MVGALRHAAQHGDLLQVKKTADPSTTLGMTKGRLSMGNAIFPFVIPSDCSSLNLQQISTLFLQPTLTTRQTGGFDAVGGAELVNRLGQIISHRALRQMKIDRNFSAGFSFTGPP
jgi:hypothetical protein